MTFHLITIRYNELLKHRGTKKQTIIEEKPITERTNTKTKTNEFESHSSRLDLQL